MWSYNMKHLLWAGAIFLIAGSMFVRTIAPGRFTSSREARQVQEQQRRAELNDEQDAAIRTGQREALNLLAEADSDVDQALLQMGVWERDIEPLQTEAAGQAIAEDTELTEKIAWLFEQERPTPEQLHGLRQRVGELRSEVERLADESTPTSLAEADAEEIHELHDQAKAARDEWRQAVETAQAIRRQARRALEPENPVVNVPLKDRMREARDREVITDLDEQRRQREQEEADRIAREQERKRLEEAATSPEVRIALTPFLAKRSVQPSLSGAAVKWKATFDAQPMSLSRLESIGALQPTVDGLKLLARIGADRDLSDPRWTFPTEPGNWTSENRAVIQKAQDMLRKYGTTLVRLEKLSP